MNMNISCNGSAPFYYCWAFDGFMNETSKIHSFLYKASQHWTRISKFLANASCELPIKTNNCELQLLHYFSSPGQYILPVVLYNQVFYQVIPLKVNIYEGAVFFLLEQSKILLLTNLFEFFSGSQSTTLVSSCAYCVYVRGHRQYCLRSWTLLLHSTQVCTFITEIFSLWWSLTLFSLLFSAVWELRWPILISRRKKHPKCPSLNVFDLLCFSTGRVWRAKPLPPMHQIIRT